MNPFGKKGNPDHQSKIAELIDELLSQLKKGFSLKREGKIETEANKSRYGDIVIYDENRLPTEIHQVGRTNKNGSPVARERKAMEEIEKSRGIKVIFHALIAIVILALTIFITKNL